MTRQEAYALIAQLSTEEKRRLYEMLLALRQNREPVEPPKGKDQQED